MDMRQALRSEALLNTAMTNMRRWLRNNVDPLPHSSCQRTDLLQEQILLQLVRQNELLTQILERPGRAA